MTGQAFFVLTALADGPRHGYGIVREVTELSQGRVKLKIGSLYGVLDRLAADGMIEPTGRKRTTADSPLLPADQGRPGRAGRGGQLRAATARVVRVRLGLAGAGAAG